ncbi:1295_t:CDS:2, partial [Paraglomus brasilianum]
TNFVHFPFRLLRGSHLKKHIVLTALHAWQNSDANTGDEGDNTPTYVIDSPTIQIEEDDTISLSVLSTPTPKTYASEKIPMPTLTLDTSPHDSNIRSYEFGDDGKETKRAMVAMTEQLKELQQTITSVGNIQVLMTGEFQLIIRDILEEISMQEIKVSMIETLIIKESRQE